MVAAVWSVASCSWTVASRHGGPESPEPWTKTVASRHGEPESPEPWTKTIASRHGGPDSPESWTETNPSFLTLLLSGFVSATRQIFNTTRGCHLFSLFLRARSPPGCCFWLFGCPWSCMCSFLLQSHRTESSMCIPYDQHLGITGPQLRWSDVLPSAVL